MLAIRLTRIGKKNSPAYRVVVADKKKAVQRKFVEVLGHYNPALKPKQLEINKDRAIFWINKGAQASDTVRNLMVDLGIMEKKVSKVYAKKKEAEVIEEPKAQDAEVKPEESAAEEATEESTEQISEETEKAAE